MLGVLYLKKATFVHHLTSPFNMAHGEADLPLQDDPATSPTVPVTE
jgi:hypothetical protein